jgi:tetratricopeptide (TPR) repeat protein
VAGDRDVPETAEGGGTLPTSDVSPAPAADGGDVEELAPGGRLGRYELIERIGAGGMGVVWAARDPELDRTVAVKILHARTASVDGELRLRREAQTMARLAHANVIRVYDVGFARGRLFLAMEHVAGGTLQDWLERAPRTTEEIVAIHVQAGRGLAAAHDAGLVHRDFKPSNVLVSDDGRVLVVDFGLARPSLDSPLRGTPPIADATAPSDAGSSGGMLQTITRAGGLVGTPAFMSPEQLRGGPVDARADQFSFCVALWRALYKQAPFEGRGMAELRIATREGELVPPPPSARVPLHLRAALERGMKPEPADRFPSMHALLDALTDDPRLRRRKLLVACGVAAAAIGGAVALWLLLPRADAADPCAASDDRFAGVWDADAARAVSQAFTATHLPYAAVSFREVARQLDGHRTAWLAMRHDSCVATHVRGEQSDAMLDLRARCLEQRRAELGAFVGELRHADAGAVRGAGQAAASVGDATACGDVAALGRRAPMPDDPARRAAIGALEDELAAARARHDAGHYKDLARDVDALTARARATDYPPILGEALALGGAVAMADDHAADAERRYEEAELAAEAGGDDDLRFDCEAALVRVVGYALERDDDSERHGRRAEALLTRLGTDPQRTGTLAWTRSVSRWWNGHYADAKEQAELAVAAFTKVDPRGVQLARALHALAIVEQELHDADDVTAAVATEERARAIAIPALGEDHPLVGQMWNTSGGALRLLHRYDEAREHLTRALHIAEGSLGADSSDAGDQLLNLGVLAMDQDKPADAVPLLERGLAVWTKAYGPDHSRVADMLEPLGSAYSQVGRDADAEAALRKAIAIHTARLGKDAPPTASSWKGLGEHQLRKKQYADARASYAEAVRALEASQGPRSPLLVHPLASLGDAYAGMAQNGDALATYQRARELATDDDMRKELDGKIAALRGH